MTPSIGVITTSTNSLSRNYLTFFACIQSWSEIADQIIIVDGGTNDNTYDFLKGWVNKNNFKVMSDKMTLWGNNGKWHPAQWTINTTFGLKNIETDWVFIINSDFVLMNTERSKIISMLEDVKDSSMVVFSRFTMNNRGELLKRNLPGFVLNMKKIKKEGLNPGFGVLKMRRGLSDRPIDILECSDFYDPQSGYKKTFFAGNELSIDNSINLKAVVYGHFFFDNSSLLKKILEFYNVFQVRYRAQIPYPPGLIAHLQGINTNSRIIPKNELLKIPHPPEIKRVIDYFFREDMVGYIEDRKYISNRETIMKFYYSFNYKLKYFIKKYKTLLEEHKWYKLGNDSDDPLNVKEIYIGQDKILPKIYRISW